MPHSTSTFPRSGVLVLGEHSVHSLVPSTLISQAESLLDSHRIEDAVDIADQQRKKLHSNISVDEDEVRCCRLSSMLQLILCRQRNYATYTNG